MVRLFSLTGISLSPLAFACPAEWLGGDRRVMRQAERELALREAERAALGRLLDLRR